MIPVARVPKPKSFDTRARRPGKAWLRANPKAKRPKDYWSPFLGDLRSGFASLCGYAAMLDPTGGTVDHYKSYRNHPKLAYEWSNYRFASAPLNSSKKNADDTVLDPYQVQAGWFEIILPSLQMRATSAVPPAHRTKAEYTLTRLKLRDGEKIVQWRRHWYALYEAGNLPLEGLRAVAPLIADAVVRQSAQKVGKPRKARKKKKATKAKSR
jgi:hypothetical protein